MLGLRPFNQWVVEALRANGVEPDKICFPGRPGDLKRNAPATFLWCFSRDGRQGEYRTTHGRLCNLDVVMMLARVGVSVEIAEPDWYGERHPRLLKLEIDDSGARERLCADEEPILSAHRDQREIA